MTITELQGSNGYTMAEEQRRELEVEEEGAVRAVPFSLIQPDDSFAASPPGTCSRQHLLVYGQARPMYESTGKPTYM